jgi:hypothetical protein
VDGIGLVLVCRIGKLESGRTRMDCHIGLDRGAVERNVAQVSIGMAGAVAIGQGCNVMDCRCGLWGPNRSVT